MDEEKASTIHDVLDLISALRQSAVEFQEHIDIYFSSEQDWQRIKDRFVTFEERFISLEARLSSVAPEPLWQDDELDYMIRELRGIGQDFIEMRMEFLRALQEAPERVM
ncbi:MAG: hypothetical protein ACJ74J_11035 [Blastocatellia bacterium]